MSTRSKSLIRLVLLALMGATLAAPAAVYAERGEDGSRGFSRSETRQDNRDRNRRTEQRREDRRDWRHDRRQRPDAQVVIRTLPPRHRAYRYRSRDYYYSGGGWYEPWGTGFVRIGAPIGLVVATLPAGYVSLNLGGHVHYRYADTWYEPHEHGYRIVEAPREAPPPETGNTDTLFAYPNAGQSEQQQADDRFECHDWASRQSGYDPSLTPAAGANREDLEQRPDYLRALSACLEGRNYTVR